MSQDPNLELKNSNTPASESIYNETALEAAPAAAENAPSEMVPEQTEATPSLSAESAPQAETLDSLQETLRKSKRPVTNIPKKNDPIVAQVEHIMQEGLADAYRAMTPVQQQEFKIKGEKTAFEIRELLRKTHVKIKKIFRLILDWLKLLPGVNKFFLVQEAKIKADKIMALKHFDNSEK